MFKPEDNHYSRFIDALQVCDKKYLDSGECKKHYNKNWWTKYNYSAVKESAKNITSFNRIPKEILKRNEIIPYLTNISKEIFNEYYKHIDYVNVCKLWLHRDTTDGIKKMCNAMEEKHINIIDKWTNGTAVQQLNKKCIYQDIVQNSVTNLSEDMFRNFYNMQLVYKNVTKAKKKNRYINIPNCLNTILQNDNLETFKRCKFLMDHIEQYLYFIVKYKCINIVKYIISYQYRIENFYDYNYMLSLIHYNNLDESSIKFMMQYLPIQRYDRSEIDKVLPNKYLANFKRNELKKINKLCKSLQPIYLNGLYTNEINHFIESCQKEIKKEYNLKCVLNIDGEDFIFIENIVEGFIPI